MTAPALAEDVRYFVTAADDALAGAVAEAITDAGYPVIDTYEPADDVVLVTVGGDGAVLYAARTFESPTILPVVKPDSEGNTIQLDPDRLPTAIERIETGRRGEDYRIESHRRLAATRNGAPLRDGFRALNDITVQHATPTHAAEFRLAVRDGGFEYAVDRVIGDGAVVATPFGATGYYRSIAGGVFSNGVGVALSNVHKPADAYTHVVGSPETTVTVEPATTKHAAELVVSRDNDPEGYRLEPDDTVRIHRSEDAVAIVRFPDPALDRRRG